MLEYIDKTHTYLLDGKIVPSVTQIVGWKYPTLYEGIDPQILKRASEYGTEVHKQVEDHLIKELDFKELKEFPKEIQEAIVNAKTLMDKYCMYPDTMEQMVSYKKLFAGTYDIKTKDKILIDIKTTSKIHVDNDTLDAPLNLQMSLYKLAIGDVTECWYLHLPKRGSAKMGKVETWSNDKLMELLKEWKNSNQ